MWDDGALEQLCLEEYEELMLRIAEENAAIEYYESEGDNEIDQLLSLEKAMLDLEIDSFLESQAEQEAAGDDFVPCPLCTKGSVCSEQEGFVVCSRRTCRLRSRVPEVFAKQLTPVALREIFSEVGGP
jgi:hypothetical protein